MKQIWHESKTAIVTSSLIMATVIAVDFGPYILMKIIVLTALTSLSTLVLMKKLEVHNMRKIERELLQKYIKERADVVDET